MGAPEQLAQLIANGAARRGRGESMPIDHAQLARLIVALGAEDDDAAFDRFFHALAAELKQRGAKLPALHQLPPELAPLLGVLGDALTPDADGNIDFEAAAARLDAAVGHTLGTSPRREREAKLEAEIRRDIADSVAARMRKHGLRPLADGDPPDDPADDP